jgi:putative spermidine/putrescine transport system permease protein
MTARGTLATLWIAMVFVILLAPLVVVFGASFSGSDTGGVVISYVAFPPERWTLDWYARIPASQFRALTLSFTLAFATAIGAVLIGVPAALGLVRASFPGKPLVAASLRAPLQIPHVVVGISFLQLYYAIDDAFEWALHGTYFGLFLGHLFLATPFVIGSTAAVLQRFNVRLEEAALSLGASPWRTLWRVTLPVIRPGIMTGALYSFIVSFVDVPVGLFLSKSGVTTYPVELFQAMENDFSPASLASSTLVTMFAAVLVLLAKRVIGFDSLLRSGGG